VHHSSSKEGGLCIGEEIIGRPMCRWKEGFIHWYVMYRRRKRELDEVRIDRLK
jgi:hypothetical protein